MIELIDICKTFMGADSEVCALNNISLTIDDGDVFGIIGASGAGKSTLLRCINLLERPESGKVVIDGVNLLDLDRKQLREFRRDIGVVFQQCNLLPQKTVASNIRYPLDIAKVKRPDAERRVAELLELIGLADKAKEYPSKLSGGQQQRVAIARALATNPKIVLCDECTSALDPLTTDSILALLKSLNDEYGVTIVVVTHEMRVVERICNKVAVMSDGSIIDEQSVHNGYDGLAVDIERLIYENADDRGE